jgi:hypothetical protein
MFAARSCGALVLLLAAGCSSHDERIAKFADDWAAARFQQAEREIDELIADESGADEQLVTDSRGLDPEIDPGEDDTFLFLQEKAMTRLAAGDLDACIDLLRRARDVLDLRNESADLKGWLEAGLVDDTSLEYRGADYERVLVPALLALVDLLEGGQDAWAYALQVGEVQERILGSTLGENVDGQGNGYNPRKQYTRVAIGAYIEGLMHEREGFSGEALKAYRRAMEWGGELPLLRQACARAAGEAWAAPGAGVVHVFRLYGPGPRLAQGQSEITDLALSLANWSSILLGESIGTLGQAPVPVPVVRGLHFPLPELEVRHDGQLLATSSTVLDVDAVARQQLDANLPWILARAALRRGVKAVAAKATQDAVDSQTSDDGWGWLAGLVMNLVLTAGENADTRQWTSLPASFQCARLELPAGESVLDLGGGTLAKVRVASGKDSYVLVLQPNMALPGVVIVDVYSRVIEPPTPEAPVAPEAAVSP